MAGAKLTKIYVTKYLFTCGILEYDGAEIIVSHGGRVFSHLNGMYFHGNDYHLTRSAALLHAVTMIDKKDKTIRKQVVKLRKLESAVHAEIKGTQ